VIYLPPNKTVAIIESLCEDQPIRLRLPYLECLYGDLSGTEGWHQNILLGWKIKIIFGCSKLLQLVSQRLQIMNL
jgi:hypothetical protein